MDGSFIESRVTASRQAIVCRVATDEDDADLRALLRDNPMGGWVSVALEREPHYFANLHCSEQQQAIIARDPENGQAIGMCSRAIWPAYIDGQIRPLGYIGELRIASRYRHRYRIIRQGFTALRRSLHDPDQTPFYLTAIVADNKPARRLLEADLPGKPTYRPIASGTTLIMLTRSGTPDPATRARLDDVPAVADCLARNHARFQFAPVWGAPDIADAPVNGGPGPADFLVHRDGGRVTGCIALWDQSHVKQAVIRGYRRPITWLRPVLNLGSRFSGLPGLPPVNTALRQVYLSFLAIDGDDPDVLRTLLKAAVCEARRRGFDLATLSLADDNPMLPVLKRFFPGREYRSQFYLTHWEDGREAISHLGQRPVHLEAGLL